MQESKLKHLKTMWDRIGDFYYFFFGSFFHSSVLSAVRSDQGKGTTDKDLINIWKCQAEEGNIWPTLHRRKSCLLGVQYDRSPTHPYVWQFTVKICCCFSFFCSFDFLIALAFGDVRSNEGKETWHLPDSNKVSSLVKPALLRDCLLFMIPEPLGQLPSHADEYCQEGQNIRGKN